MPLKGNTEICTVMFIDIVSYTPTTAKLNWEKFSQLHDVFDRLSFSVFEKFKGKVIQKAGDAFLATFKSPTNALLCGIELQKTFQEYNKARRPPAPLVIRVAIHTGEVITREGNIFGDTVNTASRIEGITQANQIVFSEATYLAMNKNEIPYLYIGSYKLKGLKHPPRLFRVRTKQDELTQKRKQRRKFYRRLGKAIKSTLLILALVILLSFILYYVILSGVII